MISEFKRQLFLYYNINNTFYKTQSMNNNLNRLIIYNFYEQFNNDKN